MLTQPIYTQCQVDNIHNMHMSTVIQLYHNIYHINLLQGNISLMVVMMIQAVVDDNDYI